MKEFESNRYNKLLKQYKRQKTKHYRDQINQLHKYIFKYQTMRKSIRSQDKSIYLAFALSPSIAFESLYDREQLLHLQFHFSITKANQTLEKTTSFTIASIKRSSEMYLYLALPNYAEKLSDNYSIKLVEQNSQQDQIVFEEPIDLKLYVHEHNTQEKDFWTQIIKHSTQTFKLTIMQRVFLKRTRFQLDDIINSSEIGEELDIVEIPTPQIKTSKTAVRKSKSHQASSLNSLISPRRLDTISEQDSTVPLTDKKEIDSICESRYRPQIMSEFVKKGEIDFQSELKKQSTWVEKNHHFDEEFFNAFEFKDSKDGYRKLQDKNNMPDNQQLKLKSLAQSQSSQKGSKISKITRESQKQNEDNSISFLDKSSLLLDMSQSELSISPDDEVCFKLKWILLAVIILALAVVASLSTDAFDITDEKKQKGRGQKRRREKGKEKQGKVHKVKERKQVRAL